ncbi:MAG: polyprenyl synthetase family protein [Clostridium sp.]|nr:polyprenyl synthetase family protein [Clostridium sp.]MCM1547361.1 polyprenyl synthetase family protein [Ruminococcus sp.]
MEQIAEKRFGEYIDFIENALKGYSVKDKLGPQKSVGEAMDYSLEAGGKRIRPMLVLEFCRICGGDLKKAVSAACALEMIHTFSLIHDDLPCMDDDDFRRGKPSCHKQFGEARAVLAGDALAIYPFEIISAADELDAEVRVKLINELSHSSGAQGMIGGQIIDMENEERDDVDCENLEFMYSLKTGALIKTACVMGCICAKADEEKTVLAAEYAKALGIAFQIIDDILDVTGDEKLLGKPVGSDVDEEKTTFVTVYGLENAKEQARKYTVKAMEILDRFDDNDFLKELTKFLLERNY